MTIVRHHLLSLFAKGYNRFKSQLQALTSSSLHVILGGLGTKSFLPVTSCDGHELSIVLEMRTAGRFFFSHFANILLTFFKLYCPMRRNKILLGGVSGCGGFGHYFTDRKRFPCPSQSGKTILINFSLLKYIK